MTFADEKRFKQAVFLLQSDDKPTRHRWFEIIKNEIGTALRSVDFTYTQMMQLYKAFWYFLYKEDNEEKQYQICEDIAKIIFDLPTKGELFDLCGLDSDGNVQGEEVAEEEAPEALSESADGQSAGEDEEEEEASEG